MEGQTTASQQHKRILVAHGPKEFAEQAADFIVSTAASAIQRHGEFSLVLTGGSTPRTLYSLLATPAYSQKIPWDKTRLFWGDERYVLPDSIDSNYRMSYESLLSKVPIPPQNVHRIKTELKPAKDAADDYDFLLRSLSPGSLPQFDLVLLGLGTNGHTASLFPHTPVLHETSRLVCGVYVPELQAWRITMTSPVLNRAHSIAFLVAGQEKASIVSQVLFGPVDSERFPAQLIHPVSGEMTWFLDQSAASLLPRSASQAAPTAPADPQP